MNSDSITPDKKEQIEFVKNSAVEKSRDYIKKAGAWLEKLF